MLFHILISSRSLRGGALLVLLSQFALCHAQESWVWQNRLPQGNSLVGICVVNEAQMMAVGEAATFMKTRDAGATWDIVHSAGGLVGIMRDVYFVDDNTGWAVGSSGRILNTVDGGQIWSVTETQISFTLYGVVFANPDTGWVFGSGGGIFRTTDGGGNWIRMQTSTNASLLSPSLSC